MHTLSGILLSAALLLGPVTAFAQPNTISYSNGKVERNKGVRFGLGTTQGLAIRISKEKAELLKGTRIEAFEAAFSTSHTSQLKFFITRQLDGTPDYTQDADNSSTRWTEYPLNTPYTITGEEFYIGYTCEVDPSYSPLLFDGSKDFGNSLMWAWNDNRWEDVSDKGLGAANLRFKVDHLPEFKDAVIKPVDASSYYKVGNGYEFEGQIYNFGSETINSFDIVCQIGNSEPSVLHVDRAELLPNDPYFFFLPKYFPTENGKVPFKISVENINGSQDADNSDNSSESMTYVYPEDMQKHVLIEGFSTQLCGNCPRGHSLLKRAISGIEEEFVEVMHHAGYHPDAFSMKEDTEYTWFYNANGAYAPGIMFNRCPLQDGTSSVVFEMQDTKKLRIAVNKFPAEQPYVAIRLDNEYNESTRRNRLSVKVHTYVSPSDKEHRLNLFLTQDSIVAHQNGAGGDYIHNHVFRGALNGLWGEKIELVEGETVEKIYEYELPENIVSTINNVSIPTVPKDMNFVAFVSDASESPLECRVYNAASTKMTANIVTGIEEPGAADDCKISLNGNRLTLQGNATARIYDLSGRLMHQIGANSTATLAKGIFLVRTTAANGKQQTRKIQIP